MTETTHGQRRHLTAAQWQALFERFEASGTSVTLFCRRESISPSSFYRWRQKLAGTPIAPAATADGPAFIDAGALTDRQTSSSAVPPWDVELDLGAGVVLRLRRS